MPTITNVTITDLITIENITMDTAQALPGQWKRISFDTKSGGVLTNATNSIVAKNPSGSTRVQYDAANLTAVSTGKYTYDFQVPANIIPGDWRVEISSTISGRTAIRNIHFEVEEN